MNCPNCQANLLEGAKFCTLCGTPILATPIENVVEEVKAAEEAVVENTVDEISENELPSASFDPGEPIAVPKQVEEPVIAETIPEVVPEIAPVESVLPEFPQTNIPQVEETPAVVPVVAPVVAPAPYTPAPYTPAAPEVPVAPVAPVVPVAPMPTPSLNPQTVPSPIVTNPQIPAAGMSGLDKKAEHKVMSTGTAFLLQILFAIPGVGFIASIIAACAGKESKSRKNMAKAALIWHILLIVIALASVILTYFFIRDAFDAALEGDIEGCIEYICDNFGIAY